MTEEITKTLYKKMMLEIITPNLTGDRSWVFRFNGNWTDMLITDVDFLATVKAGNVCFYSGMQMQCNLLVEEVATYKYYTITEVMGHTYRRGDDALLDEVRDSLLNNKLVIAYVCLCDAFKCIGNHISKLFSIRFVHLRKIFIILIVCFGVKCVVHRIFEHHTQSRPYDWEVRN